MVLITVRSCVGDSYGPDFTFYLDYFLFLTLSSPGFFGSSQPGGGGAQSDPHHNFFVIGRIMMKLGKLVKCFKLYLMMEFWWVNWL